MEDLIKLTGRNLVYLALKSLLDTIRQNKPEDRSEEARRWAIFTTMMEEAAAYFYTWIYKEGKLEE